MHSLNAQTHPPAQSAGPGAISRHDPPTRAQVLRSLEVRHCTGCLCTDDQACEGGCYWLSADRCSSCGPARLACTAPARPHRNIWLQPADDRAGAWQQLDQFGRRGDDMPLLAAYCVARWAARGPAHTAAKRIAFLSAARTARAQANGLEAAAIGHAGAMLRADHRQPHLVRLFEAAHGAALRSSGR